MQTVGGAGSCSGRGNAAAIRSPAIRPPRTVVMHPPTQFGTDTRQVSVEPFPHRHAHHVRVSLSEPERIEGFGTPLAPRPADLADSLQPWWETHTVC